ncbi:MAG: PIG-L deacetylase family protein [Methanobacteriota archaeon]
MLTKKTVLTISAHADDAHVALGGTMRRLLESGDYDIHYVAFSIAEDSVPKGFPAGIVEKECLAGLALLGVNRNKTKIYKYPVRKLPEYRQEILEILVKMRKELDPSIVFIPSTEDIHQDHIVVSQEGIRAFRRTSSIFGYDFPWNVLYGERLNLFYEISKSQLDRKVKSLQCYKSQIAKMNNCLSPNYVRSLAVERGQRIGVDYAEGFEIVREVRYL